MGFHLKRWVISNVQCRVSSPCHGSESHLWAHKRRLQPWDDRRSAGGFEKAALCCPEPEGSAKAAHAAAAAAAGTAIYPGFDHAQTQEAASAEQDDNPAQSSSEFPQNNILFQMQL